LLIASWLGLLLLCGKHLCKLLKLLLRNTARELRQHGRVERWRGQCFRYRQVGPFSELPDKFRDACAS
jgi:hypothetical protein